MATPDTLAKTAREKLALALNALQTAEDAPVFVLDLAEPIAQSMALLHKIERSRGTDLAGKDIIAANVRLVLDKLQAAHESHATIDALMEHIAGSLASVHQLARSTPVAAAAPPAPAPAPSAPAAAPRPVAQAPAPQAVAGLSGAGTHILSPQQGQQVMQAAHAVIAQNAAAPPGFPAPPTFAAAAPGVPTSQAAFASAQPAPAAPPAGARPANQTVRMDQSPVAVQQAHAQQAHAQQAHAQQAHAQQAHAQQARPAAPTPVAAAPAMARPAPAAAASQPGGNVLVELGAHSSSNFYKGLGGNDVIEHGGLFVATYKIPKLGTQVNLRVTLPGDYEFHATGVVQWIREAQGDVDPGFGARLTQITPEGRQLVYRYTRNREPMFYDDL